MSRPTLEQIGAELARLIRKHGRRPTMEGVLEQIEDNRRRRARGERTIIETFFDEAPIKDE